ncbi:GNAT family N-acetyltransferase [Allostreptomyces psammosilenae]|uniref:RimJ/RimL family protein N-acetyltransferase n=1 Tax=Allostreptomyces psammosilenae TaxID=1892865 RepID=A0A852ZYC5_9ACTN|nr:GNAT family N-acetyltransferase [Allostreptomyces psammosilenae]NYI07383.1 RimJ/RimL family protein N-acetyltransferase [Allostreptomyces psammosilenae]
MVVTLRVPAGEAGGAPLLLRPWSPGDAAALVEVHRDPALRHWTGRVAGDERAAASLLANERRGWLTGERRAFAVLEELDEPDPARQEPGRAQDGRSAGGPAACLWVEGGRLAGHVVLKGCRSGAPVAEVGYWTAAHARGRGVAPRALEAVVAWAFETYGPAGLRRLELLHQVDNTASCRVAAKTRFVLDGVLPPAPPAWPGSGHRHVRHAD